MPNTVFSQYLARVDSLHYELVTVAQRILVKRRERNKEERHPIMASVALVCMEMLMNRTDIKRELELDFV